MCQYCEKHPIGCEELTTPFICNSDAVLRIDKHGEPVNYVYAKLKADRMIYVEKSKRCQLYAKNHELEAQKAQDAIRMMCLKPTAFPEPKFTEFIAYWTQRKFNHIKHRTKWLEYVDYFKKKAEEH